MSADKKYSEEFVNQSWDNMHSILDKEMPQKKKRRFPLWLFLGSFLLVLSLFIFNLDVKSPNNSNLNQTLAKSESTIPTTLEPNESSQKTLELADSKTTREIQENKSTIPSKVTIDTPIFQKENKVKEVQPLLYNSKTENSNKLFTTQKINTTLKKVTTSKPKDTPSSTNNIPSSQLAKAIQPLQSNNFLLSSVDRNLPVFLLEKRIDIADEKSFSRATRNFYLAGAGLVSYDLDSKAYGLQTRGFYSPNGTFGLEVGAGLFRHYLNNSFSNELENFDDNGAEILNEDLLKNTYLYVDDVRTELVLTGSFGFRANVHSKLALGFGIKTRQVLNRKFKNFNQNVANGGFNLGDTHNESEIFRKSFYNPYIGLNYQPTKNIYVRLESNLSMRPYLLDSPNTFIFEKVSFVQAEFGYRF